MSGPNYVLDKGFEAGEALTKYTFVSLQSDETVDEGTAGAAALGVVQGEVEADQITRGRVIMDVRLMGISRCVVQTSGTVTAGGEVAVGTAGTVVDATTSDIVVGIALQGVTSAAEGHHIDVLLTPGGHAAA